MNSKPIEKATSSLDIDLRPKDYSVPTLKEWNPNDLPENFSMILFGKRFSGKTFMLRHIVHSIKKRFDEVFLFSLTARLDEEDYTYIPETHRIYGLDEIKLERILNDQEQLILEMRRKGKKKKDVKKILILLDDIITEDAIRTGELYKRLYVLGRHLNISVITLTQSVGGRAGCPLVVRDNCSAVVSFFLHNENSREQIVEQYASIINKKVGDLLLKSITANKYTAIVFDLTNMDARHYEEYCYHYKVPENRPDFVIGGKKLEVSTAMDGDYSTVGNIQYNVFIPTEFEEGKEINSIYT